MALTYNGTGYNSVGDAPATATAPQNPTEPVDPNYPNIDYPGLVVPKASVDTDPDSGVNFDALIAALNTQVEALLADFDVAGKTVEATGQIINLTLESGQRFSNAVSASQYVAVVRVNVLVT